MEATSLMLAVRSTCLTMLFKRNFVDFECDHTRNRHSAQWEAVVWSKNLVGSPPATTAAIVVLDLLWVLIGLYCLHHSVKSPTMRSKTGNRLRRRGLGKAAVVAWALSCIPPSAACLLHNGTAYNLVDFLWAQATMLSRDAMTSNLAKPINEPTRFDRWLTCWGKKRQYLCPAAR